MTNDGHQNLPQLSFIKLKNDKWWPPEFNSTVVYQAKKLQTMATRIEFNCRSSGQKVTNDCHQDLVHLSFIRPKSDKRLPLGFSSIVVHQVRKLQIVATRIQHNFRDSGQTITKGSSNNLAQLSFIRARNYKWWPPEFKPNVFHQARTITKDGHQHLTQLSFIRQKSDKWLPPEFKSIVVHQAEHFQMMATGIKLKCCSSGQTITNECHQDLTQLSPTTPRNDKRLSTGFNSMLFIRPKGHKWWPPELISIVVHQAKKLQTMATRI